MPEKRIFVWLVVILALACFFRLWNISSVPPGLYPDEAINGNNALEALSTGQYKAFYPENNGREGLFINIAALSVKIFGNKPWAVRLPSAIFGILTVLGVFLLTRKLLGSDRIALLASFLLAVSFWHINFSRIGFRAIMAPFFLVWAFYFLFSKKRILGGIFFGLGFHSYIAYRITPLLLVFKRKKIALFLIFAFLASLPLAWYFLQTPQDFFGRTSQISIFTTDSPLTELGKNILKTFGMFWFKGDSNWRHNIAGEPQLWWPIGILFIIGIWDLIRNLKLEIRNFRKLFSPKLFLFAWLIIALLPVIVSNEALPHALRAIIALPAVFIIAGLGLEWLINLISKIIHSPKLFDPRPSKLNQFLRIRKELKIALFLFLIIIVIQAYQQYFINFAQNPNVASAFSDNYVKIGNYLNSLAKEQEKYVIVDMPGVDVRGLPIAAQTVMFITNTFSEQNQKEKNIFYILPDKAREVSCSKSCLMISLKNNAQVF